jgi:NitT/TauT family transport system permease protein/taurine transport system permease protein
VKHVVHAKSLFAEPGRWLLGTGTIATLVLAWFAATDWFALLRPLQFPSPAETYDSLLQLVGPGYADETLGQHVLASIQLVLTGFIAASLTGLPLGLLMGLSRPAYFFFNGIFQIMRPIAPIAWIPLTILWFGLGATAKVFVIWLAAFAPVVINTQTGVRNVEPVLIAAAQAHGALGRTILFDIVIPGALPTIFTGLRISLQACWMVLVAAELVGSFAGLGHIMIIATRDLNPGMIVVAMAGVATLGVLFTATLSFIERQVTPWRR